MSEINQDFEVDAGDSIVFEVTVTDDATDLPLDISAAAIRWALSAKATDAAPLVEKSLGSGITVVSGAGGIFRVAVAPADTVDLAGRYHHEAEVTIGGAPSTVSRGVIKIRPTVLK
jgi:hypothetical protein